MNTYHIVGIGDPPGNQGSENRGGTCAAWAESKDKENTLIRSIGAMECPHSVQTVCKDSRILLTSVLERRGMLLRHFAGIPIHVPWDRLGTDGEREQRAGRGAVSTLYPQE